MMTIPIINPELQPAKEHIWHGIGAEPKASASAVKKQITYPVAIGACQNLPGVILSYSPTEKDKRAAPGQYAQTRRITII